jgi:NAD(P)-dependent dehydrogenase (short-subunit alcohol dehydrogenase family)
MPLKGKVTLVTGAGRGIGKALAIGFAGEGADIIAVSRTLREIEQTAVEARKLGREAMAIVADVSQANDVQSLADEVARRFDRLDVLVNNAALRMNHLGRKDSYTIPLTELTIDDWDSAIAVNLRGPFLCVKKLLPLMRNRGGSIINVSAGGGKKGMAGRSAYCASKFGLEGLTQSLAIEFKAFNIAVNSLSPGRYSILTDEAKKQQLRENPNISFMKPEMMVPPALFLALQDGHGTTGQHLEALEWLVQNNQGGQQEWRARL